MDPAEIDFLVRFILESDAIENITGDASLIREQVISRYLVGHVGAMLLMRRLADRREPLTRDAICRAQKMITAEQHVKGGPFLDPQYRGVYRSVNVRIAGRGGAPPNAIESRMSELLHRIEHWRQHDVSRNTEAINLRQIAVFHFDYEDIHPFADGNGRSGRAIVYYLMRYADLRPFVFTSGDKHETYYRCFKDSQAMCMYFEHKARS